jgi:hypothetical protein
MKIGRRLHLLDLPVWGTIVISLTSILAQPLADIGAENELMSAARAAVDADRQVFSEIQVLEPKALAAAGDVASRKGDRLALRTGSGEVKTYDDRPECKSETKVGECQKYVLVAHARSRGVFVVAVLYYESLRFLLVDDVSGDRTILQGFPHFSPSGEYAALLLMNDPQIGYAVQVWRRSAGKFVLDWSGSPYHAGMSYTNYKLIRWDTDHTIELQAHSAPEGPRYRESVTKQFKLRHTANGWEVLTRDGDAQ